MKVKHLNENQVKFLDSAEFRIQRYEDYISELFHKVHDGYMNGMVNAKAYADVLAKIYSVLETLDYVDEPLKESYMDVHEGMNHMNTLDMMAALKSVVKEYGHMELVTPIRCEIKNDDHGRRLALIPTTNEGLVEDSKVKDAKFAGTTNEADEDGIMDEPEWVDTLSEGAEKLHTKPNGEYLDEPMYNSDDYDDDYSNDYDESLEECSGIRAHKVIMGEA